jgi:hypothetical protein
MEPACYITFGELIRLRGFGSPPCFSDSYTRVGWYDMKGF